MPGPFVSAVPAAATGIRALLQRLLAGAGKAGRGAMDKAGQLPGIRNLENLPPELREQLLHRQVLSGMGRAAQPAIDVGRRGMAAAGKATQRPRAFLGPTPDGDKHRTWSRSRLRRIETGGRHRKQ